MAYGAKTIRFTDPGTVADYRVIYWVSRSVEEDWIDATSDDSEEGRYSTEGALLLVRRIKQLLKWSKTPEGLKVIAKFRKKEQKLNG